MIRRIPARRVTRGLEHRRELVVARPLGDLDLDDQRLVALARSRDNAGHLVSLAPQAREVASRREVASSRGEPNDEPRPEGIAADYDLSSGEPANCTNALAAGSARSLHATATRRVGVGGPIATITAVWSSSA